MDDPINEIRGVVLSLTTGNRIQQQETLENYFTRDASFKHPFCAVHKNRDRILSIFQWYKILSPKIEINVNSVAFDEANLILYLNISQTFRIWFVPLYRAPVTLTTILKLATGDTVGHTLDTDKYFIRSQEDLYQTDEWIKFILPHFGVAIVGFWHWVATLCCVIGAKIFGTIGWLLEPVKRRPVTVVVNEGEEKPILAGGEVTEAVEVDDRRDSKGVKQGDEELPKTKLPAESKIPKAKEAKEADDGTVRVNQRGNGKKSVREMERKSNLGNAKLG